jgi:ABC-type transporter Mla MlaB component
MAKPRRSKKGETAVDGAAPDPRCVTLTGPLEIQQVEAVRAQLLPLLQAPPAATVDIAGITSIDTAGVQLLLALRAEAPRCGVNLEFRGASAVLDGAFGMLGLAGLTARAPQHGV